MTDLSSFVKRFGGELERLEFYSGECVIFYNHKNHIYYLETSDGLVEVDGVSSVCHILDKSNALVPWACTQMSKKLLATAPYNAQGDLHFNKEQFETLILDCKSAHKERLEEAGDIGHLAHAWIERYIKSWISNYGTDNVWAFDVPREDPRVTNCCLSALKWMSDHNVRWIYTERKTYSKKYNYAGTKDGLCLVDSCSDPCCCYTEFKDHLTLSDWKSSNGLWVEYRLQTAAYKQSFQEESDILIDDIWIIQLGKTDGIFKAWYMDSSKYAGDIKAFLDALELKRSVAAVEADIKKDKEEAKQIKKEQHRVDKEAASKLECKGFKTYKAVRFPACNGGNPCVACLKKYEEKHNKDLTNTE